MGKAAKRARKSHDVEFLNLALINNAKAMEEGPKKKRWTQHDLKTVKPLTGNQEEVFHAWYNGFNLCSYGSAGTGKSFLSLYLALTSILERREQSHIIIVRSAVPTRDMGFMPGTLEEKQALYERPYHSICHELLGKASTYQDMKDAGMIEFETTSFLRGLTWDNAIIIVEEVQNMTYDEINTIMTRVGNNSRVIVNGDTLQTDLKDSRKNPTDISGMDRFLRIIAEMKIFTSVMFTVEDIVRGPFAKAWIKASQRVK